MKKLIISLMFAFVLALSAGSLFAQEGVADTISIDDMAPILYQEETTDAEDSSNTGLYIGIAVVAIVAGVVIYKVVNKKR